MNELNEALQKDFMCENSENDFMLLLQSADDKCFEIGSNQAVLSDHTLVEAQEKKSHSILKNQKF